MTQDNDDIRPADLKGILKYVPEFRDQTFVIAIDGRIIDDDNFANLTLDIAVLRSLNIRVVITHGIGFQLEQLAQKEGCTPSDIQGSGPTDEPTLNLAILASALVAQRLTQGLVRAGLRCVNCPACARATEVGVIGGRDYLSTGKVDKIDKPMVDLLLREDLIPIVSPILFDKDGRALRANSDLLASELASQLKAAKLIFLTQHPGLTVRGEFLMNVPISEIEGTVTARPQDIDEPVRSKATQAVRAVRAGVPRAHILDGRVQDALLTEIFSKVGIGTMIYGDKYQQIRRARRKDAQAIFTISRPAVRQEMLKHRTRQSIEKDIDNFFVYEIDESIIGCAALFDYPEADAMELGYVFVVPFYQGKGVGSDLVRFGISEARRAGRKWLFILTTQTLGFFKNLGFVEIDASALPPSRLEVLQKSGRNSKVMRLAL